MNEELLKILESVQSDILTPDVKEKLSVLFESQIKLRMDEAKQKIEEENLEYKQSLTETYEEKAVEFVDQKLIPKIGGYIDFVAEEYLNENRLAIQDGLKASMYEELAKDLRGVLAKHQIKEDKMQESEEVFESYRKLKEDYDKLFNQHHEMKKELEREILGLKSISAFNKVSEGMTDIQKNKLRTLAEDFNIDNTNEFERKLSILKESIISEKEVKKPSISYNTDDKIASILSEDVDDNKIENDVDALLKQAMKKFG